MSGALALVALDAAWFAGHPQTSLDGAASESSLIGGLLRLFFWVTLVVYLLVMAYLAVAVQRGRRNGQAGEGLQGEPPLGAEPRWHMGLTLFASATAAILFGLTLATWFTDRSIAQAAGTPALEVEVIGHQWWWEVRYHDPIAAREVRGANELIIPADRPVHVSLSSQDVIHSMWIPNLAGKQDLIPGRSSDLMLNHLRPGEYRAQCAEFCGLQHAHMALPVTVQPGPTFNAWYEAQLVNPPPPAGGPAQGGMMLFQNRQCAACHNIGGTPANGQVAPDLTHVASRKTLAAGTLVNTPANLRAWIADPQKPKPGNAMPKVPLSDAELDALVAYLETLK